MGLESVIVRQITNIAKNSGKLDSTVDALKSKVLDKGLELLEETGLDPSTIPFNIPKFLGGAVNNIDPSTFINPTIICSQPTISVQKRESSTRLINTIQEDVDDIYRTTNAIKEQLIRLQEPVNALNNSIGSVTGTVNSVSAIITTIKLLPFPVAVGGFGIPANILTIYSSTLDNLDKLLSVAKANLRTLPKAIAIMAKSLNEIILKVNSLSLIIDPLLQFLQLSKSIIELQDNCPNVTQASLDQIKDDLLSDITGSFDNELINTSNNLNELLQPNANPGYFYKNFRFTVEEDPDNPFFLPSRRIRCFRRNSTGFNDGIGGGGSITFFNINKQTNPNFPEGSYSFSSDLQVLVNEGKFAVDVYTDAITLWEAPQYRSNNVVKISDSYINLADATYEELQQYAIQFGYDSAEAFLDDPESQANTYQSLPNFIVYGGVYVNLNSSPTDVAFGANKLITLGREDNVEWYERDFNQGGTVDVSSYIQSGTIQVNSPVSIRMKTFGGTGNLINGKPRFTEALLTIKRSFNIQDDVNPFTGKVVGAETVDSKIENFEKEYGTGIDGVKTIDILNTIYETFNDGITTDDDNIIEPILTALKGGESIRSYTEEFNNLSNRQQLLLIDRGMNELDFEGNKNLSLVINSIYPRFEYLLSNQPTLKLSKKIFGNVTITSLSSALAQLDLPTINWWGAARKFQYAGEDANYISKQIILSMLYRSSNQFIAKYNEIYGDRVDYNNGAWVGGASSFPIIPTQVGDENADITIPIQVTQLAAVGETVDEIIGSLELLGTYSYDLEIINSTPIAGGEAFFYPTNFTTFTVEDKNTPLSPNEIKQTNTKGY